MGIIDLHQVTKQANMTSTVKSTYMKRMLTLAMAVLCIAVHPVSAQKSEANENDKFYKAREIIEAKGDLSKAAELLGAHTAYIEQLLLHLFGTGVENLRCRRNGIFCHHLARKHIG